MLFYCNCLELILFPTYQYFKLVPLSQFSAETSSSKEMSKMSAQAIPDKDDIPERLFLQLSLQSKPYLLDEQKTASG